MTPQALLAEQIERISDSMASFVESTEADVLRWRPEMPGSVGTRTVLEMVAECVTVNRRFAAKLAGEGEEIAEPTLADAEDAVSQIVESGKRFAGVIANLSDEDLERDYPIAAGNHLSGTFLIIGAYRNMAYHCGQINLIQMLRGDAENHRPESWYGPARWKA